MKNFIRMEKVFKCLKRKKLCEEESFYNLEKDSYYLDDSYKLGYFLMIQNERGVEVFIVSKIQNILHILILNLENSTIISKIFYYNYVFITIFNYRKYSIKLRS